MEEEHKEEAPELAPIDPETASITLEELVRLDLRLKEEGSSVLDILKHLAHSSKGIRL